MYILEDRSHYVKQALVDNLLKRKNKKISILSCEEDEEKCITKILGKIYNLHRRLSSDNF